MKTPTLIVRLVGLYLLFSGVTAFLQVQKMKAMQPMQPAFPGMPVQQNDVFGSIQLYAIAGVFVGLALTIFAGRLADILTFDSSPRAKSVDFSDQLLERKDRNA